MKQSDLHRELARIMDMCDETRVEPLTCVKFMGKTQGPAPYKRLTLDRDPDLYEFAVAILEGRPVFLNDVVFIEGVATIVELSSDLKAGCVSWDRHEKVRKTFLLNGVELPCPIKAYDGYVLDIGNRGHIFSSLEDRRTVRDAINKILTENTK